MRPFILLILLMLTACTHFQERPLNLAASATQLTARSLHSKELAAFLDSAHLPKSTAWNLDKLTLAALFYHPDLAVARAQADMADAAAITAAQRPNPSFSATPTWISNLAYVTPWIFVNSLSIPIETAGKRGFRMDKSKRLSEAARLRLADTAWLVRGRLRLALLDVYAAQESLRLLEQQHELEQSINQALRQQELAGELSGTDLLASQLALAQGALNCTAAQKKLADSKAVLAAAIGVPVAGIADIELDFGDFAQLPELHKLTLSHLQAMALRERPDVLAMLTEYAAAEAALHLEIANQYPNIQANPGYTWNTGENRWLFGATALQLPVFNQNEGPIAEMEAKRQETAARLEALQLRIIGDLDRAYAAMLATQNRSLAALQLLQNRQANVRTTQDLVKAGESDGHALATAKLEQSVAERAQLDVQIENQQATALLEATLRQPMTASSFRHYIATPAFRKILP